MKDVVVICGDRRWGYRRAIRSLLGSLEASEIEIVTGGAPGVDTETDEEASGHGFKTTVIKANWNRYGRGAGPIRNGEMLDRRPFLVVGIHEEIESSKGTADCLSQAEDRGIPYGLLEAPRRVQ